MRKLRPKGRKNASPNLLQRGFTFVTLCDVGQSPSQQTGECSPFARASRKLFGHNIAETVDPKLRSNRPGNPQHHTA